MKEIVEQFVGEPLLDTIIPELPLKRDLVSLKTKSAVASGLERPGPA